MEINTQFGVLIPGRNKKSF